MGNNGDPRAAPDDYDVDNNEDEHNGAGYRQVPSSPSQQVNSKHRLRPRGLMPTDGQDAYRSIRASKRSRNDRLSYLVATGHMDPEETEQLHKPSRGGNGDLITTVPSLYSDSPSPKPLKTAIRHQNNSDQLPSQRAQTTLSVSTKRSNFDPSFLNNLNHTLANSPGASNNLLQQQHSQSQEYIFRTSTSSPKKGGTKKKSRNQKASLFASSGSSGTNVARAGNLYQTQSNPTGEHNDRKFRQTFTEVTLPMKTSPAFEYILRDNKRRNKRCCLWFLYSSLVTICIAIILFCSIHLALRSQTRR